MFTDSIKKYNRFFMLILYTTTLLNLLLSSRRVDSGFAFFFCIFLGIFYVDNHVICK